MIPTTVELFQEALPDLKILVVGDLMLDRYLWGNVGRISPEAPVPVVEVSRVESRPGGAANVALNLAAMGCKVSLCGVVGDDEHGKTLLDLLKRDGFDIQGVKIIPGRPTTVKTRVIGNNQQMLRVDQEVRDSLEITNADDLKREVLDLIDLCDAVIFEDYDKGLINPELIAAVVEAARNVGIPTVVDPKFRNFMSYQGVTLFKPNLKELNEALGLRVSKTDHPGMVEAVKSLRKRMPHTNTLITLSEHGVLAVDQDLNYTHIPAHFRKITDVSGAGDTVVAILALCLASGMDLVDSASAANLAGGLVCEEVGVVPIQAERLFQEMLKLPPI